MRRSLFLPGRPGRLPLKFVVILAVTALLGPSLLVSAQDVENATFHGNVARTGEQPGPPPKGKGQTLWRFQTEGAVRTSPVLAGGLVHFGSNDGRVYAIDAQNGEPRWSFETGGAVRSTPTIADGLVVFGSDDGYVYCVSAENGELQWRFLVGRVEITGAQTASEWLPHRTVTSSPLIIEGTVFIGGNDQTLHALDLSTGIERWNQTFRSPTVSAPSYKDGVIFVGTEAGVHAVDALTGSIVWEAITGLPDESDDDAEEESDDQQDDDQDGTPNSEDTDDDNDGIPDDQDQGEDSAEEDDEDEEDLSLNEALLDGALTVSEYFKVLGGFTWNVSASPVVVGELIYAVGYAESEQKNSNGEPAVVGGVLLQLDIQSGAITGIWIFRSHDLVTTTPAVVDDAIYLGSDRGMIFAVEATLFTPDFVESEESQDASEVTTFAANQQRWGVQTEKYVLASPAVVGETVYTGNAAGTLYALDTKTGRERWTFQTGGPIWSSPAIVDGVVYVGSDDGFLYAIGGSS
jgi:eukaryotic-like serine/threonine-protein kinase